MLEETIGADRMELPFAHCHDAHLYIEEVSSYRIPQLSAAYSGPTLSQALQAMAQAHADDADGEDPPLPLDCESPPSSTRRRGRAWHGLTYCS